MAFFTNNVFLDGIILTGAIYYALYKYFTWNFDYWKQKGVNSIKPKPFYGNFEDVIFQRKSIGHFLAEFYNQVKEDYFGIWIFGTPHFIVKSPELIKNILVKDFNYFNDRTVTCDETADPIMSKALFFSNNPYWKSLRQRLSPIFTSGKIKAMVPLMNEAADDLKMFLYKSVGESIDMKEAIAKFSTDVITSCAFGVQGQSFQHNDAPFRNVGRKMFAYNVLNSMRATSYFFAPTLVKLLRISFFESFINDFCRDAFLKTIKMREANNIKRNDIIDMIIDMKKQGSIQGVELDTNVIVAQPIQFFAAGFETTSSTIAFTLYELCLNPQIQLKLRKEINKVLEDYEEVTYEALHNMKYLDKVVKETLRKYPVLPFLDRRCVQEYKIPNSDLVIEKGTPVYIPMFGLHYDPNYFPDPEKFDPERFSEENVSKRPAYAYIPFGEGPHNCIGERFGLVTSKLGIVQVISNFHVEQTEDTPVPIIYDTKSFILQSVNGLHMKVTPYNRRERFGLVTSKLGIVQVISNFHVEQTEDTPVPIIYDTKSFILQSVNGLHMKVTPYNRRMSAAA